MRRNALYESLQLCKLIYDSAPVESRAVAKEHLDEAKRKWRRYLRLKYDDHFEEYVNGYVVNGGGTDEYRWTKVLFPGETWDSEDIEEFIQENWRTCRNSPYDCTGDIFTCRIECFNIPSGVVCYIMEAMDV